MSEKKNSMATVSELLGLAKEGNTTELIRQTILAQETLRGAHVLMSMVRPPINGDEKLVKQWDNFLKTHQPPDGESEDPAFEKSFLKSLDDALDEAAESVEKKGKSPQQEQCVCPGCRSKRGEPQCDCPNCQLVRTLPEILHHPIYSGADFEDVMEIIGTNGIPITQSQVEEIRYLCDSIAAAHEGDNNIVGLSRTEIEELVRAVDQAKGGGNAHVGQPQRIIVGTTPDGNKIVIPAGVAPMPPGFTPPVAEGSSADGQMPEGSKIIIINM